MSKGFLDAAIDEADMVIKSEQSYLASTGERALNTVGGKALVVSEITKTVIASPAFSIIKDQVSNFVENSKMLLNVLDEVGKAHPFIQAALVIFKAGIQLEITRRENDEKVLALNMTMCDMMSILKLLRKVASPEDVANDGLTIAERLQRRMAGIIASIKSCAKLCDSYQRRHVAIKFLTSTKWKGKFTSVAEQFIEHQRCIQMDLQMHISIEIINTNAMLSTLSDNVTNMMNMVFDRMHSAEEREFSKLVDSRGGVETVLGDDKLLKEIIKNQQQQQEEVKVPIKGSQQPDFPSDVAGFRSELNKDVDTILAENTKIFNQRFDAIEIRLKEFKGVIVRQSDRVIAEILAGVSRGPHERIVDRDLYHVWQEMGWKGSVKATHFVMAVHDHFSSKSSAALNEIQAIANKVDTSSPEENLRDIASIAEHAIPATPAEDLWSLEYITVHRAQPLIEALDDDGSSFITVNEVNTFTTSRPEGWSLPRWIACWTVGFEMTTQWYYRRIRQLLSSVSEESKNVLPANRRIVSQFLSSTSMGATENLLAGLRDVDHWDGVDWVNHALFSKFKGWIMKNEKKMHEILRTLVYYIDQDNTLGTVTGGSRPEKYLMPLLYLLMRRSHWVMKQAQDVILHPDEFRVLTWSMLTVHSAVRDRVKKLQAIYKLQNINKEEKMRNVFFGLYAYTFEESEKGEFWTQTPQQYDAIDDEPPSNLDAPEPALFYGPAIEEYDWEAGLIKGAAPDPLISDHEQEELANATQTTRSLVGPWSGSYSWLTPTGSEDGPVSFSIIDHAPNGRFHCLGVDTYGPFTVDGTLEDARISFLKEYTEEMQGQIVSWRYKGTLNKDGDEITGFWGYPKSDEEEEAPVYPESNDEEEAPIEGYEEDDFLGTFVMHRRSVDYFLYRPSDQEFADNKTHALWKLVRNFAKYRFQKRYLTWEGIRDRRDKRHIHLELSRKRPDRVDKFDNPEDQSKWTEVVRTVHPSDLELWYKIAQYKNRRESIHMGISCDKCTNSNLKSTRTVCIECSESEPHNTVNLCGQCKTEGLYRKRDNKHHKTSHTVIQFRRVTLWTDMHPVMSRAKSQLEALSDKYPKYCTSCEQEIPEKPYWYCTECKNNTFVCIECNDRFESDKPWLLQRKVTPDDLHDSVHTMVLSTQKTQRESDLSTDERLTKLEAKLDSQATENRAFETFISGRLQRLEELLELVITATKQAQATQHDTV